MQDILNNSLNRVLIVLMLIFLWISCGKEVSVTQPRTTADKGLLHLNSDPKNLKIYLNGKYTGKNTPDSISFLEYQSHEILLKKDLYRDSIFNIEIHNDQPVNMYIDYRTNPWMYGSINCQSEPKGAQIFLNDSATGKFTPDTLYQIIPGNYTIKFKYPDHRENEKSVTVESKKSSYLNLSLQDTSVWVDYQTANSSIPYDYLTDIICDSDNYKWIGTNGLGMVKFNESEIVHFTPSNSGLPGGSVTCIDVDELNRVWIGTTAGVAVYDEGNWNSYSVFNSALANNNITDIYVQDSQNIWVGTQSGLFKITDTGVEDLLFNQNNNLSVSKNITSITVDMDNVLWICTINGIASFNGSTWKSYYNTEDTGMFPDGTGSLISNSPTASTVDSENRKWFGYQPDNLRGYYFGIGWTLDNNWGGSISTLLPQNRINNIYYDESTSNKWLCTSQGLAKFNNLASMSLYTIDNIPGLSIDDFRGITKDKTGIIWITTYGNGLLKYKAEMK